MVQKWEKIGEETYRLQLSETDKALLEKHSQYDDLLERNNVDQKAYSLMWNCGEHVEFAIIFAPTSDKAIRDATMIIRDACTKMVNNFCMIRENLPKL